MILLIIILTANAVCTYMLRTWSLRQQMSVIAGLDALIIIVNRLPELNLI